MTAYSKTLPNGLTASYGYDLADRVTSIAYTRLDPATLQPIPVETITYAYDPGGQRIAKGLGTSGVQETAFAATYDEANRMTSITLGGETFSLAYDANGNLTTKTGPSSGTTVYSWDARGQLIAIAGPGGSATFGYDAFGRRIEKTVNGTSTGYLYDGAQAIAELKGSALDAVYHTGLAIDEVLARYAPTGNKTLLTDALQSVIAQANEDQTVGNYYAYSAYGEVATLGPDGGNDLQYAGLKNDGTGLYHATYRYYDPVIKQWISEDPIGLAGGINGRQYVGGSPINSNDPLGLIDPNLMVRIRIAIGTVGGPTSLGLQQVLGPPASQTAAGASAVLNTAGAVSNAGLAYAVATTAAGSAVGIAVVAGGLAFASGVQAGVAINNAFYYFTGCTVGGYIYNKVNSQGSCGCP